MVLYINALRHDKNTASIFLDAWVIQQEFVPSRLPNSDFLPVMISEEECPIWKHLLPCAVERCRNGWIHGQGCEYRKTAHIPLSVARGTPPICSCGQGKSVEEFPHDPSMHRLMRKATRVALHPIFSVPLNTPHTSSMEQVPSIGRYASSPRPATVKALPKCGYCGSMKDSLKACQRCGVVRYCNHDCQKAAWKTHKKFCNM